MVRRPHPLRGAAGTLACATSPFLLPGLGASTGDFRAHLGLMRAQARIRHLAHIGLVHQIHINGSVKNRGGEFHFAKFFAFQI